MWIACVCLVGLIWVTVAVLPGNPATGAWIMLPAIAIMLQNALQHVYWCFYFKQYSPEVITAALCLIPLGGFIITRAVGQGYVPIGYVAACAALVVIGLAQTLWAGNKMTPLIRTINIIGVKLSERIK